MNKTKRFGASAFALLFLSTVSTDTYAVRSSTTCVVGMGMGATAMVATAGAVYYLVFSCFTPQGRMRRARGQIGNIQANRANQIIKGSFESDEQELAAIKNLYAAYDFDLHQASRDLQRCLKSAQKVIDLLEKARLDIDDEDFALEVRGMIELARQVRLRSSRAIVLIRNCPQYEKHLENCMSRKVLRWGPVGAWFV